MIRRPLWLGTGIAIGVGGTLWVERRVRTVVAQATPEQMAHRALTSVKNVGARTRHAYVAAQEERRHQEAVLRLGRRSGSRTAPGGDPNLPAARSWPAIGSTVPGHRAQGTHRIHQ